jgi:hypothetical protein
MYQKSRRFQTKIITYTVLVIFSLLVIGVFVYSYVSKYQENKLDIKSRYTFSIRIDDQWNVVSDDYVSDYDNDNVSNFTNPDMVGLGTKWLEKYISQYRQKYVPYSKYIVKSGIDSVSVLDLSSNTVLLSFWVIPQNLNSDYFSSWEGIQDDGRIKCEWVVSFYLDNNYDNTAKLYVTSVMSSEDYGLKQYYAQQGIDSGGDTEITSNSNKDQLANYSIKDNSLLVTYDREKYISVPVSYSYLLYEPNSSTTLKEGSYMITTEKTAFVYGGKTVNNTKIPVTVVYSRIYSTSNGGESWDIVGSGPATNIIKGVVYVSSDVGFFCYDYVEGMDSNLYKTDDGGKTFAKVMLEEQELDSSAANPQGQETETKTDSGKNGADSSEQLRWGDVYKEALTPVVDSTGIITIYLTQGKNAVYNDGKTAAKYQSSDKGSTWKYIGQVEIKD